MTALIHMNHITAVNHALGLLSELRQVLDFIRASTEREELAASAQNIKGPMAALHEELEDTISYRSGQNLVDLAENLERTHGQPGVTDNEAIFSINELRYQASGEPRLLERTYRVLHQAWEASIFPEQFKRHLEETGLATSFGWQVAEVLIANFSEAKAR
ncbi:MAG: hypothetical protein CVV09_19710 [Gammaproteobacteria bacterium HGW-Gammaproteobacteria-13]|nr:MAG: hypothetical protein CVV09_19710 [Gammaproteobacteria bacterium HGW-Gammaproteobacteria-13]